MYLKRKIDDALIQWRQSADKKPLIVKGPRQVGKTASILHFGQSHYKSVITINFVEEPNYKQIVADGYSVDAIIKNITLLDPAKKFLPHDTLLVFDELQEFPEIATSLKFFSLDGRFDVICSGSMLGINYRRIESNSVGYKTDYEMRSFDFEEFLWAKGYGEDTVQDILSHMQEERPFSELELSVFNALFLDYCVLGGMPAVVRAYIESGTFEGSLAIQRQLIIDYKEDVRKYAEGMDQTRILNVFNHIPVQLARDNKKFQISRVTSGARFRDYRGCIEWLDDAGMINLCYCLDFPELPLRGNYDPDKFKIYVADTGLLVAMLDEEAQEDLRANKNLGVYKGALYENMIGEALVKSGYQLYYYKKGDSTLEEDFFVRTADKLIPIEVKAHDGRSKSLKTLIESSHYPDITSGIKLSGASNIGRDGAITTYPLFCAFLLKRLLSGH